MEELCEDPAESFEVSGKEAALGEGLGQGPDDMEALARFESGFELQRAGSGAGAAKIKEADCMVSKKEKKEKQKQKQKKKKKQKKKQKEEERSGNLQEMAMDCDQIDGKIDADELISPII
jgi:hypothetical protein